MLAANTARQPGDVTEAVRRRPTSINRPVPVRQS